MSERYELETRLGAYRPWANDTDWERKRGHDMWGKADVTVMVKTTINPHLPHLSGSHSQFGKNKLFSEMTTAAILQEMREFPVQDSSDLFSVHGAGQSLTHRGMLLLLCK